MHFILETKADFHYFHEVSQIVPVYEGQINFYAMSQQNVAGKNLDFQLEKLFNEKKIYFNCYREKREIRKIKEKICYVSLDFDDENRKWYPGLDTIVTYENHEKEQVEIQIGNEKFHCH